MDIPHMNAKLPVLEGVNSTVTGWFKGRSFLILYSGMITEVPQVSFVSRTKVSLAGTLTLNFKLPGSKPFFVIMTLAVCGSTCGCANVATTDSKSVVTRVV